MFFEINKNLCDVYSGLNPLDLLNYPAEDVFTLINDTLDYKRRNSKQDNEVKSVRRPAGDNWF